MKKVFYLGLALSFLTISGCASSPNIENSSSDTKESSFASTEFQPSSEVAQKLITSLNTTGNIEKDGTVMYSLEVTEVIDVTEQLSSELINDTNYLDYFSDGQAKQAVKLTLKMSNLTDETLSLPFLDDVNVVDSDGISLVGGWKNINGDKTEFGLYQIDSSGEIISKYYDIEPGATKLATSTVLLATISDNIRFDFKSNLYDDVIRFELPVVY